jgi:hypothetical protein
MNFAIYDDKLRPPPAPRAKRTAPRKSAMSAAPLRDRTNREATAAAKAEEEAAEEAQRLLEEEEETAAAAKAEEEAAEEAHRLLEEEEEEAKTAAMAAAAQQGVAGAAARGEGSLEYSRKLTEEEKEAEAAAAEAKAAAAEQEKEAQRLVDLAQQRAHIKAAERQQAVEELACGVDDLSAKFEDLALLVQACSISVGLPPPAATAGAAAGSAVEAVGMAGTERPKKSGCSAAEAAAVGRLNRDLACVRNVLRVLKHNQDLERRSHCRACGGSSDAQHGSDQAAAAATAENQDPAKVDKITAIQKELEDTAAVLHNTIDGVLERGVKLDQLVANAHDLSKYSKMGSGYKQAKKTNNSCCVIA